MLAMTNPPYAVVAIGVDCATQAKHVGLARIVATAKSAHIDVLATADTWTEIVHLVADWLAPNTLLALDAPLGWPAPLGPCLTQHQAGAAINVAANAMFRRLTDDVVADAIGKRSLDVGADRIARTARAALAFLQALREYTAQAIPLAWTPGWQSHHHSEPMALEVYPAATLASRGWPSTGYKGAGEVSVAKRRALVEKLASEVTFENAAAAAMTANDHVLDAALCSLSGLDFANGNVITPSDRVRAKREGWIWVRPRPHTDGTRRKR